MISQRSMRPLRARVRAFLLVALMSDIQTRRTGENNAGYPRERHRALSHGIRRPVGVYTGACAGTRPVELGRDPISRVRPWAALLLVRYISHFHVDYRWYEPSLESVGPFSCRIADGVMQISWYDHEGIVTTSGLNLAEYFDYYLALLFILQRFDRSAWGRLADENLRSDRSGAGEETTISVEGREFT